MKLILLSDLHLLTDNPICRKDNLVDTQIDKLKYILSYAEANEAIVLQAGDFFDSPRSYYLLARIIRIIKRYKTDICAVFGGRRHDTYLYSNEDREATNLGILEKAGLVTILNDWYIRPEEDENIHLFGCSFGEEVPNPYKELATKRKTDFNILVIHAPIAEAPLFHNHEYMDALTFLKENKDFDLILCADIHRKFSIEYRGRRIINTGPILRKTADLYNFDHKPCFAVYNTEDNSISWVEIPSISAEEVLSREHLEENEKVELMLTNFVDSVATNLDKEEVDEKISRKGLESFIDKSKVGEEIKETMISIVDSCERENR